MVDKAPPTGLQFGTRQWRDVPGWICHPHAPHVSDGVFDGLRLFTIVIKCVGDAFPLLWLMWIVLAISMLNVLFFILMLTGAFPTPKELNPLACIAVPALLVVCLIGIYRLNALQRVRYAVQIDVESGEATLWRKDFRGRLHKLDAFPIANALTLQSARVLDSTKDWQTLSMTGKHKVLLVCTMNRKDMDAYVARLPQVMRAAVRPGRDLVEPLPVRARLF